MSLQDIYQEVLLAHNEHPNNFKALEKPSYRACGNNPLCGDQLSVFVNVEEDIVKNVTFTGEGCAICKASASLMTLRLESRKLEDAINEAKHFIKVLSDEKETIPQDLGELEALLGVRKFPARLKCATLAWHTFLKAFENKGDNSHCNSGCHKGNCCSCCH